MWAYPRHIIDYWRLRAPHSALPPLNSLGRAKVVLFVAVLAAATFWTRFIVKRYSSEPSWADASGYFNSASLIFKGEMGATLRVPDPIKDYYPYDMEPVGFHFDASLGRLVPTYFVGLPILLAGAHILFGWHMASYVVVLGSAGLLLVYSYLILRSLEISLPLAMVAVVGLAWSPVFVFASSQTYSDVVASASCALAVLCILKPRKRSDAFDVLSGASLGFALLVRSTSCLLIPALLILAPGWRRRIGISLGFLPFVAVLEAYQHVVYGSATTSGYGAVFRIFDVRYVPDSLANFAFVLPALLPICLLSPIGAFCASPRWTLRLRTALVVWVASFGAFYAFYFFTGKDWTYLRFIEPTFPALLALGCMALETIAARCMAVFPHLQNRWVVSYGLLGLFACFGFVAHFPDPAIHDREFVDAREWSQKNLPPRALVVCEAFSGSIYFGTQNSILRWDITSKENISKYLAAMWKAGQPVYSLLDASEVSNPELRRKVAGHWEKVADLDTGSAWRIDRP